MRKLGKLGLGDIVIDIADVEAGMPLWLGTVRLDLTGHSGDFVVEWGDTHWSSIGDIRNLRLYEKCRN